VLPTSQVKFELIVTYNVGSISSLYQAFRHFGYINKDKYFLEVSVKALKNIKYCAITISILYEVSMSLL
jgi:hypothetical protein